MELFQHHQQSSTSTSQQTDSASFYIPWCPAPSLHIMVLMLPVLLRSDARLADYSSFVGHICQGCIFLCCVSYIAAMLICVMCILMHIYVCCMLVAVESYAPQDLWTKLMHAKRSQPSDLCSQCQALTLAATNTTLSVLIGMLGGALLRAKRPKHSLSCGCQIQHLCSASDILYFLLLLTSRVDLVQVAGQILEVEDMVQTEATRKRMKHLAHLPLSGRHASSMCLFMLCICTAEPAELPTY